MNPSFTLALVLMLEGSPDKLRALFDTYRGVVVVKRVKGIKL